MAKTKEKKKNTSTSHSKKGKGKSKNQLFTIILLVLSAVFLSTAVFLTIALLPMFVAFFTDRSKKKYKALTVGSMNIAGCTPFLLELWTSEHTLEKALSIILDPMAITVVYAAAGIGYLIDWSVTLLIANTLYQKGVRRIETIDERQKALIERWGREVNGSIPLDEEGFPIDSNAS